MMLAVKKAGTRIIDTCSNLPSKLILAVNVVFLTYLVLFAVVSPKPELVSAVAFEISIFALVVGYRFFKSRTAKEAVSQKLEKQSLKTIETKFRWLSHGRLALSALSTVALGFVLSYLLCDLTAVYCVETGRFEAADSIYEKIAPPSWTAIHPAFSMELLAGAHKQAKDVGAAEAMQLNALRVRQHLYGRDHAQVAAAYANLGEFYRSVGNYTDAESYLTQAISVSKRVRVPEGYGYPMTKLACLLRDQGRYEESAMAFEQALAIRERIFGSHSAKVADTISQYLPLLAKMGDHDKEQAFKTRLSLMPNSNQFADQTSKNATLVSYLVLLAGMIVVTQKRRLVQFAAARIKTS